MSAIFCEPLAMTAADPASVNEFFNASTELRKINKIIESRECPDIGRTPPSCAVNFSFGFFFDGTNNNLDRDRVTHNHSNVARLYLAFPGADIAFPWPDAATRYPHYFRTYVPGVGTKFDAVGDTGEGEM